MIFTPGMRVVLPDRDKCHDYGIDEWRAGTVARVVSWTGGMDDVRVECSDGERWWVKPEWLTVRRYRGPAHTETML